MNAKQLQAFVHTAEFKKPAAAYLAAKVVAEIMRKEVDAYIEPIWAGYGFKATRDGSPILTSARAYLTDDARLPEFYAACDRAHAEQGHKLEPGYCPALIAENKLLDAENAILKALSGPLGFDYDSLNRSMAVRRKMLDVITGLATKVIQEERAVA